MVDLRIYRGLLVLVAFAVIVFGFSLQNQPHGLGTQVAPGQFFTGAQTTMKTLAREYPDRTPGSAGDEGVATYVEHQFGGKGITGFNVSTDSFPAQTSQGLQMLTNVIATRPGLGAGTVVVVSHRDATGSPARADLSGTAVMLELAQALSGETLNRTVTLISTSGQVGGAGATELAHRLGGQQVDAVIVLGNLAGKVISRPAVVPWSSTDRIASPQLRNTLGAFVAADAGIKTGSSGLAGQFARLAFPFALTEQAPFAAHGIPAVLLSLSGDRPAAPAATLAGGGRISGLGAAVLQTVNALANGPAVAGSSSYLILSGKLVPGWAVRLLVLALILPVVATTLDAVARTRRRGHTLGRWVGWVLSGVLPFLVGLVAVLIARAAKLFSIAPPGAVGHDGVAVTGGDTIVLIVVALLVVASFVFLRPACLRLLARRPQSARRPESPAADAAAVALSVVMCVLAVVVWFLNPFAALLLVPALHVWLGFASQRARSRAWAVALMLVVGFAPAVALIVYYANAYGLSPIPLAFSLALLPGGGMSIAAVLYWTVGLGCLVSAAVIGLRAARAAAGAPEPAVTVRGPASYAGPGSLGGTESALRR